jgi:hypothetical protein
MWDLLINKGEGKEKVYEKKEDIKSSGTCIDNVTTIEIEKAFPHKKRTNTDERLQWRQAINNALKNIDIKVFYKQVHICFIVGVIDTVNGMRFNWDVDNKDMRAISVVINALKGKLFNDDDFKNVSISIFGKENHRNKTTVVLIDKKEIWKIGNYV